MKLFEGIIEKDKFAELDEKDSSVVICNTIDMPHVEDVTVQRCNLCGAEVWLAGTTVRQVDSTRPETTTYLMCGRCYLESTEARKARIAMPTDEQIADVATRVGKPFEVVKKQMSDFVKMANRGAHMRGMSEKYESN